MNISVVTISYNQSEFLSACLDSVIRQKTSNIEFIVVDAGSTDGSRDIINQRRSSIDCVIFEPDRGPADGLNKGFARATGEILYYLNSDDVVFDGAFDEARVIFAEDRGLGVLAGAGLFIDSDGRPIRRVWSDPVGRLRMAYGGGNLIQPATFIRASDFRRVGGFNEANMSNWDGELITDLYLMQARFRIVNRVWGGYRLHPGSITASAKLNRQIELWSIRRRERLGIGYPAFFGRLLSWYFRVERLFRHPGIVWERVRYGRVFGRAEG